MLVKKSVRKKNPSPEKIGQPVGKGNSGSSKEQGQRTRTVTRENQGNFGGGSRFEALNQQGNNENIF